MDVNIAANIGPAVSPRPDVSQRPHIVLDRTQATHDTQVRSTERARSVVRDSIDLSAPVQLALMTVRQAPEVRDDRVQNARYDLQNGRTELAGDKLADKLFSL